MRNHTRPTHASDVTTRSLEATGDKPLTKWQWYEFVERKARRGRFWKMMGKKKQYTRELCEELKSFERSLKKKGEQEYRPSGSWNRLPESAPEQVKCCNDTDWTHRMMKHCFSRVEKERVGRIQKHFQK